VLPLAWTREFTESYDRLKTTKFVAYDERFFDIAGPDATITQIAILPQMIHEAPSWIPETNQLLFTEWGPIDDTLFAQHPWQWLIDLDDGKNYTVSIRPS
jgi:gluconolactonase